MSEMPLTFFYSQWHCFSDSGSQGRLGVVCIHYSVHRAKRGAKLLSLNKLLATLPVAFNNIFLTVYEHFSEEIPHARLFRATFQLRDIPYERLPICALSHMRDIPSARLLFLKLRSLLVSLGHGRSGYSR